MIPNRALSMAVTAWLRNKHPTRMTAELIKGLANVAQCKTADDFTARLIERLETYSLTPWIPATGLPIGSDHDDIDKVFRLHGRNLEAMERIPLPANTSWLGGVFYRVTVWRTRQEQECATRLRLELTYRPQELLKLIERKRDYCARFAG